MSQEKHRNPFSKRRQNSAIVLLALVGVLVGAYAFRPSAPAVAPNVAAEVNAGAAKPVVAFIGDSYTTGVGGTGGGFVSLFSKSEPWQVENLGVGGTGYAASLGANPGSMNACGREICLGYIDRIEEAVALDADVVVVSGGRNESKVPSAAQAVTVDKFYKKLRTELPDSKIVAFNPVWDSAKPPASVISMAGMVRSSVESVGGSFVDIGQPLQGRPDFVSKDGAHPNDKGYEALYYSMRDALRSIVSAS